MSAALLCVLRDLVERLDQLEPEFELQANDEHLRRIMAEARHLTKEGETNDHA